MLPTFQNIFRETMATLRRPDPTAPQDRSRERQRRVLFSAATDVIARSSSIIAYLVSVRLTVNYLDAESFGLFAMLISFVAMFSFADLGIGNSLLNFVARTNGKDDLAGLRTYISSALFALGSIGTVLMILLFVVYSRVPWELVYKVATPDASAEAAPATAILAACIAISIPASLVYRTQLGLQLGFVANLWQAAGSAFALIAVAAAVHFQLALTAIVAAFVGAPVVTALANNAWFFGVHRRDLRPRFAAWERTHFFSLVKSGLFFFILQLAVALAYLSDSFVIARTIGANKVAVYALCSTMFSAIQIAMSIILTPLWPAYGDAIARSDLAWTKKVLSITITAAVLIPFTLSVPLLVWGNDLLHLWTGQWIDAPFLLLLGLALWRIIESIGSATATFLNASNLIAPQVLIAIVMSAVAICAKFYLVDRVGVAGAVWATIFAYLTISALPQFLLVRRALSAAN